LDSVAEEGRTTLLVDAGDLFGQRTRSEREQTEFLCSVTGSFGYDAIGLGEMDLNYGLPFLKKMIAEYGLPFTNANVRDPATGELILPEYLIVERAGHRFGLVSVLDPEKRIITMTDADAGFQVADPLATLRELIPQLRRKVDTVILLSHLGDTGTENIVREVNGIDIAVIGHSYRALRTERAVNHTLLVCAVHEGRYIGRADLTISKSGGEVEGMEVEIVSLDDAIADDPEVAQMVADFHKKQQEIRDARRAAFPRDLGSASESFLGDRVCRTCHEKVWETQSVTAHAHALRSVRAEGLSADPECLVCHTTGYRYAHGYGEDEHSQFLANVSCEACHGYGTQHARDGDWLKEARNSCVACHDLNDSPHADDGYEFDYATYWAKIEH
jgi:hypothetical protein